MRNLSHFLDAVEHHLAGFLPVSHIVDTLALVTAPISSFVQQFRQMLPHAPEPSPRMLQPPPLSSINESHIPGPSGNGGDDFDQPMEDIGDIESFTSAVSGAALTPQDAQIFAEALDQFRRDGRGVRSLFQLLAATVSGDAGLLFRFRDIFAPGHIVAVDSASGTKYTLYGPGIAAWILHMKGDRVVRTDCLSDYSLHSV